MFSYPGEKPLIPNSYSRQLDNEVAATEMPYGYTGSPPPADTGDYDIMALNSKKQYSVRGGKVGR